MNALGAELRKILTTRTWWVLALVLFGYVGVIGAGLGALFGWSSSNPNAVAQSASGLPSGTDVQPLVYSFATSVGYVFPVLLGALATTGEFRHQTLTPTFLATPRRTLVLAAKTIVLIGFGAVFGVVAWIATLGLGAITLSAFGLDTQFGLSGTWAMVGRGILAMALWAGIGVGLGALVKSQSAAIVIVLAFTQFVEPLLRFASSLTEATANIGRFLPGAASDSLVGASFFTLGAAMHGATLDWWQGGLVLLAIAVLATVGGYFTSWRRDIT
ncbi:ABC transporter permease [Luethyella okanaganae]|uniref:ABC transporter permease n=1 Tax=Luethyella okanaganae TaxID=69372 RepID=A0ABW1VGK5_9MICO